MYIFTNKDLHHCLPLHDPLGVHFLAVVCHLFSTTHSVPATHKSSTLLRKFFKGATEWCHVGSAGNEQVTLEECCRKYW